MTSKEIEQLRNSVNRQTPFGKSEWRGELCKKMGWNLQYEREGGKKERALGDVDNLVNKNPQRAIRGQADYSREQ